MSKIFMEFPSTLFYTFRETKNISCGEKDGVFILLKRVSNVTIYRESKVRMSFSYKRLFFRVLM